MRILERTDIDSLRSAIASESRCDYLYMYPPRQAYRQFRSDVDAELLVAESLAAADRVNLYLHFPFCRQICSYCNLYAVASPTDRLHERYVQAVVTELRHHAPLVAGKQVRTLYFGGGTPSMVSPELLGHVLDEAASLYQFNLEDVPEVALEVAPDTATPERLERLRSLGFTRINVGVQTSDPDELHGLNRRYADSTLADALGAATSAGFDNVCVDLIFGLEGQTFDSWERSVEFAISYQPETICAYGLTVRPGTGLARRGFDGVDGAEQYRKWDHANAALIAAGYERQTHVRWAKPGRGGYLQKEYHWASEPLLGIGAGARSYLSAVDTRNGYSLRKRTSALEQYLTAVESARSPITDGFLMDDDERIRKAAILGLQHIDRAQFTATFGTDITHRFGDEIDALADLGLLAVDDAAVTLTEFGVRHRDIAVQPFVSDRVRALVQPFAYDE